MMENHAALSAIESFICNVSNLCDLVTIFALYSSSFSVSRIDC